MVVRPLVVAPADVQPHAVGRQPFGRGVERCDSYFNLSIVRVARREGLQPEVRAIERRHDSVVFEALPETQQLVRNRCDHRDQHHALDGAHPERRRTERDEHHQR